jgi:hypothetical protein
LLVAVFIGLAFVLRRKVAVHAFTHCSHKHRATLKDTRFASHWFFKL